MIRFRNPGTQYSTQIQVIKQLYAALGEQTYFTLDDMAVVIAENRLLTAYGYAGNDAIMLSNTEQDSMNSAKMNAKMYAEVFRMLGWVTPYSKTSSYPLVFTYIGIHVALSDGDSSRLYEQCVLGINNPTELTDRMSYNEKIRFFKCALRTFIDLGGIMYKHELCLGPMSINDQDEVEYKNMLNYIRNIRGNHKRLKDEFSRLATSLNMKITPVDNCTRLPIAFMKSCNWIESVNDSSLYGNSMSCLRITQHGREIYDSIKDMYDMRLEEFNTYSNDEKLSLIRLGVYGMLYRSGYDLSIIEDIIRKDSICCEHILHGRELLFSPCQTLRRQLVEEALGISLGGVKDSNRKIDTFDSSVLDRHSQYSIQTMELNLPKNVALEQLKEKEDLDFLNIVSQLCVDGMNSVQIVEFLYDYYKDATQNVFYPLIATMFKIIGFNCSFSRPGDNGSRWDAIIEDNYRSIPIEIKSPTEELHLSLKAIRQALENKIVLLSRKTYITNSDVTSLAIGYCMPNERAEVSRLISDIKATYGYKIGVLDFKSLLSMSISILVDGVGFDKEDLYYLEGLLNANIQSK